jgi:hypothetical protein
MNPAKTVFLATILLVGVLTVLRDGAGLLAVGLLAAFLLTAKAKTG